LIASLPILISLPHKVNGKERIGKEIAYGYPADDIEQIVDSHKVKHAYPLDRSYTMFELLHSALLPPIKTIERIKEPKDIRKNKT
jgi:hypothetical protein